MRATLSPRQGEAAATTRPSAGGKYGLLVLALLSVAYFAALVSRSPAFLRHAQFWAEDGKVFYEQAHEFGFLATVFRQFNGYLHLLPRLVAGLSLLFPLAKAPLIFALAALIVQTLPAIYLSSPRMRNIGPLRMRILLSLLYLAVPNVAEVHGVLVNVQFHLAVLCLLILLAAPSGSRAEAIFDYVSLAIGALTGPFCIFLLPVAVMVYWTRRERRNLWQLGIVSSGVTIQGYFLLLYRPRMVGYLGASVYAFCRILTFQIVVPAFCGRNFSDHLAAHPVLVSAMSYGIAIAAFAVLSYVVLRGTLEVRCVVLFGAAAFIAALVSPAGSPQDAQYIPAWHLFERPLAGARYWYIPELAFIAAMAWLLTSASKRVLRIAGVGVLCLMLAVYVHFWKLPKLSDQHWDSYVAEFRGLPVGAHIRIPINPPGWFLEISKTPRDR